MCPTYDHYCETCDNLSEVVCKIADRKQFVKCPECGGSAERIISAKIQRVEPLWLESAKQGLQPDARAGIRDRHDLNRHMKQEGIQQVG